MLRLLIYISVYLFLGLDVLSAQGIHLEGNTIPPAGKIGPVFKSAQTLLSSSRVKAKVVPQPLQSDLYIHNLGFFCRQELKIEQQTRLPLRLRLGSLEYTNWYEGKTGCGMPGR